MAQYNLKGLPQSFTSNLPTTEQIQAMIARKPTPSGATGGLAEMLGLVEPRRLSPEVAELVTPEGLEENKALRKRGGNWGLIQILLSLASLAEPGFAMLAGGAGRMRGESNALARNILDRAESREWAEQGRASALQQEGLLKTPASAEAGYMPVGVARGITANATAERAQAALDKAVAQGQLKLESLAYDIIAPLVKTNPAAALEMIAEIKQAPNAMAALMESTASERLRGILKKYGVTLGGKKSKGAPAKAEAEGAMPETAEEAAKMGWTLRKNKRGESAYISPDGSLALRVE